jgi:RNA polymerase sigma-70 factor, ECF subfamily
METARQDDQEVEWVRRIQRGDGEAYAPLVERYQRRLFSLVYRMVGRREEVEELVQEIFVKAFLAAPHYNFEASFGTWLMRIAINHCYDHLRRRRASRLTYFSEISEESEQALESGAESEATGGERLEADVESRELAQKLLERAPPQDRVILTLKELEDLSVEEIADLLKLRPSTVKVRLHRARKRMLADYHRWRQGS